jgi:hypothetical protein
MAGHGAAGFLGALALALVLGLGLGACTLQQPHLPLVAFHQMPVSRVGAVAVTFALLGAPPARPRPSDSQQQTQPPVHTQPLPRAPTDH